MHKKVYLIIIGLVCLLVFFASSVGATKIDKGLVTQIKKNIKRTRREPKNANAYFELAMSYAFAGRVRKSWKNLEKVGKLDKNYDKKAVRKYSVLSKKHPYNWKYKFKLAFGYYFAKQKHKAIGEFSKILKIKPKHVWALGYKALILGEQGKTNQTISLCKKALAIESDAAAIHFLLSQAYKKKGKKGSAFKELLISGKLEAQDMLFDQKHGI